LSAYGDDWNDISNFRQELEEDEEALYNVSAILSNPAVLDDISNPSSSLLVIAGIESPYTDLELEILVRFMEKGGSILVLGDYDYSNTIAELFELEFVQHKLWDQNYRDNVSLIQTKANLGSVSYNILLNDPVAIKKVNRIEPRSVGFTGAAFTQLEFMSTSKNSWIDSDDDGAITPDDEAAPGSGFWLGVECDLSIEGKNPGSAVFISDSSIGINHMWNEAQNSEFLIDLVARMLPNGGTVLFDESRHTQESLVQVYSKQL